MWLLSALAVLTPVSARELIVQAARVTQGGASAHGVELRLRAPDEPGAGLGLRLKLKRLEAPALGYDFRDLDWRCELRPRDVGVWRCAGPLRSAGAAAGELVLDVDRGATELRLQRGRLRLQASLPQGEGPIGLQADRLPVTWLQPMLGALWAQARLTGGFFDADLELDLSASAPRLEGRVSGEGLGFDTEDGRAAAADIEFQGRMGLELSAQTRVALELAFSGGELLAGPAYVDLPAQPVQLQVSALGQGGRWTLERLEWNDPESLHVEASAELDTAMDSTLRTARLSLKSQRADVLVPRYLDAWLGTLGLPGLEASGAVELQVALRDGQLHSLQFAPELLNLRDPQERFELQGLAGGIGFTREDSPISDRFVFERLRLYDIAIETAAVDWLSAAGQWRLQRPAEFAMLGGRLRLGTLQWDDGALDVGESRFAASAQLQSLSMAQLAEALQWPPFEGEISGDIPGVHYAAGVLSMDGALNMQVFDGEVEVSGLAMERPFGVAPTLTADVVMRRLDLQPLTAAFGFGEISGRMNGQIQGLRLLDWSPIAFDARFATDEEAEEPRRISQRAVRDLSSVGGMGAVAALQQGLLRTFETFPYARIGIACRLRNHVCSMDGVSRTARGYTLVEGSGLPRISVNGIQREVDWPVLVDRLKAVTQGQRPTIQ